MSAPPSPDCMTSLDAVLADIWPRLVRGKADRRSPLHTLAVATVGMDRQPEQRIMVLRAVDPPGATLRFHTDIRSSKVAALSADSSASVLAYDPQAKVQLRLTGTAQVHHDDAIADAAWGASTLSSRRCYLAQPGPGTVVAQGNAGLPDAVADRVPTAEETAPARANFAILIVSVTAIDWLYLAAAGHRRAHFTRNGTTWDGHWLIP